jgi:hypothetical protein
MSHTITVSLNPQQYKKMLKNKTVQLSHGNLMHSIGGSLQPLNVSKDLHTKINRAIRNNKGIRLTDKHYIGGKLSLTNKILKPLTNGVSKVFTNKKVSNTGTNLGELSNDKILPFIAVAGKPVFIATASTAGTVLGGPVGGVTASIAANEAYNRYAQTVADRQKDKNLKKLSDLSGKFAVNKLNSAVKGGSVIKNTANFLHTQGDMLAGNQIHNNVNIAGLHKLPNKVGINSFSANKKFGNGFLPLSNGSGFKTI